ncbi:DUF975 family protein [Clostridium boliviensis]|uniref:DUF975 family protein n=1 Tax=Clostridium boliviensis TaxID=318465 RepID=A0ABU4GKP0_9CLOT|nr:DUF975 family protein [Clostridium boliviensis]MDW2797550.1 DUF975 family protein [Clostridium boliviensis]
MNREALKTDAKDAMSQALISPYLVTVIMGVILTVLSVIQLFLDKWEEILENTHADLHQWQSFIIFSIVFFVIYFIISTLLEFGYSTYCLKVAKRDESMSYGDLFSSAYYLLKALGLSLMVGIFITLWTLLLIIPGIIAALRYSQAVFIMVENPDKGIFQCIRESKEIMDGHLWEYFVLNLSFILWILLAAVTCGLAYIYVYPYMTVTLANYYIEIKD